MIENARMCVCVQKIYMNRSVTSAFRSDGTELKSIYTANAIGSL